MLHSSQDFKEEYLGLFPFFDSSGCSDIQKLIEIACHISV